MKFGTLIKLLRERKKVKRPDFARSLGVTSNYVGMIEANKRLPNLPLVQRMTKILNVEVYYDVLNDEWNNQRC